MNNKDGDIYVEVGDLVKGFIVLFSLVTLILMSFISTLNKEESISNPVAAGHPTIAQPQITLASYGAYGGLYFFQSDGGFAGGIREYANLSVTFGWEADQNPYTGQITFPTYVQNSTAITQDIIPPSFANPGSVITSSSYSYTSNGTPTQRITWDPSFTDYVLPWYPVSNNLLIKVIVYYGYTWNTPGNAIIGHAYVNEVETLDPTSIIWEFIEIAAT